jgi:hypothetical protein
LEITSLRLKNSPGRRRQVAFGSKNKAELVDY